TGRQPARSPPALGRSGRPRGRRRPRPGERDDRGGPCRSQLLDRLRRFAFWRFGCSGVTTAFAISRIAFAKSDPDSANTAGLPRLTQTGTTRSDGISWAMVTLRAVSTSRFVNPTFEFALFRTYRTWLVGNERSSRVWSARRTFFSVGTSRPQRTISSS